jgi:GT2 family glycosyltransferase
MAVELSIIIVNWNGGDLLRDCLRSLARHPPLVTHDIIVVDNASSDDSVAWLRSEVSTLLPGIAVHIFENAENAGFGKANNQAINFSQAPMLFLLNPDTEVTKGAIDTLIACLNASERVGACGPRLINTDGSVQPSAWRNPPAAWETVLSQMKLYVLLPRRIRGELLLGGHWDHNRERPVPMLSGAAIMVRRAVVEAVGGFDERFHMYGEDNEWCLRMARGGWRLMFQPAAVILHHGGQSSLQRWSSLEKMGVQLAASYFFQQHSLPRRRLIANQLASYIAASGQDLWRRLRGVHSPEVKLAREIHREHLKRALAGATSKEIPKSSS